MFLHSLLMQETKNTQTRKDYATSFSKKSSWYHRTLEVILLLWKQPAATSKASVTTKTTACNTPVTTAAATTKTPSTRLRKCSSLKVATSFTRVCLCAPISSYNEVFQADVPPRRSYSYPRAAAAAASKPLVAPPPVERTRSASGEGRRLFRGKSLTDDMLMRRFVVDEEATRRRNQMEMIKKRHDMAMRRRRLGPSPLSRMALAEAEAEE